MEEQWKVEVLTHFINQTYTVIWMEEQWKVEVLTHFINQTYTVIWMGEQRDSTSSHSLH